jgi:hypothetical protein
LRGSFVHSILDSRILLRVLLPKLQHGVIINLGEAWRPHESDLAGYGAVPIRLALFRRYSRFLLSQYQLPSMPQVEAEGAGRGPNDAGNPNPAWIIWIGKADQ